MRKIQWDASFAVIFLAAPLLACDVPRDAVTAEVATCRVAAGPVALPATVLEASGAAVSLADSSVVWTHNDSGGEPELFAVSSTGELLGRPRVSGAENVDWEAIATGSCGAGSCIYLADTGDNDGERDQVSIYRVGEPDFAASATSTAERLSMRYPGGPRDVEAMFVLPRGQIYLVAKGGNSPIEVFRYPSTASAGAPAVLESVRRLSDGEVPLMDRVTGAAASRDGEWIALRTRTAVLLYRTDDLVSTGSGDPIRVDVTGLGEFQGEGIGIRPGGTLVLTSEGDESAGPGSMATLRCDGLDTDPAAPRGGQ